jgi:hypothetical protein
MSALHRQIRRFRDEEDGLVMTEFLIMLPLLVWTFMALFIYWDAFRTINMAQKAAYSVSDVISRQSDVTPGFINGMQAVSDYLMNDSPNVELRITSVEYDQQPNEHRVLFSMSPGNKMPALTNGSLLALKPYIPIMADNDSVVIVEANIDYQPAFDVGIVSQTFENFVVTRPRYARRVCLTTSPCPPQL